MASFIHALNELYLVGGIFAARGKLLQYGIRSAFSFSSIKLIQDFTTLDLPYASTVIQHKGI